MTYSGESATLLRIDAMQGFELNHATRCMLVLFHLRRRLVVWFGDVDAVFLLQALFPSLVIPGSIDTYICLSISAVLASQNTYLSLRPTHL